jgi:creatinine amidohydrolase
MPAEFRKIPASQLEAFPREKTVFFFPVGPLEDHGPHLPMGLDLEEADRLCFIAAQHLEEEMPGWVGVVMPQAPLGIDSNTTKISITVRPYVLRDWLVDACRCLMKAGFFHFVCFSGNLGPKQMTAIEEAGAVIQRAGKIRRWGQILGISRSVPTLVSASSGAIGFKDVLKSPFWPDPEEHGGKRDTSVALTIVKDWVDGTYLTLPQLKKGASRWSRNRERRAGRLRGYWGDPKSAEVSLGDSEMLGVLDRVFPKLRAVWEGANPNSLFRSWYSILPPNKSFFKAWLLTIWIIVLLAAWGLLNSLNLDVG